MKRILPTAARARGGGLRVAGIRVSKLTDACSRADRSAIQCSDEEACGDEGTDTRDGWSAAADVAKRKTYIAPCHKKAKRRPLVKGSGVR